MYILSIIILLYVMMMEDCFNVSKDLCSLNVVFSIFVAVSGEARAD